MVKDGEANTVIVKGDQMSWNSRSMPIVKPGEKVREPHYSGGIALDHHDPSNVYLSRKVDRFFEVEHWKRRRRRRRRRRWIQTRITSGSETDNIRPYVVVGFAKNPIVLWMTVVYNHYTQFETNLRINEVGLKEE